MVESKKYMTHVGIVNKTIQEELKIVSDAFWKALANIRIQFCSPSEQSENLHVNLIAWV